MAISETLPPYRHPVGDDAIDGIMTREWQYWVQFIHQRPIGFSTIAATAQSPISPTLNNGTVVFTSVNGTILIVLDPVLQTVDFALAGPAAHVAVVTLTNAQILALPTTPITLVAAPAAGVAILLQGLVVTLDASAGALANVTADVTKGLLAQYSGGNAASQVMSVTGSLSGASWHVVRGAAVPIAAAAALQIASTNDLGNYTGGHATNTGVVVVTYNYVTLATGAVS
jgi:hypothetical protein